MLKPQRHSRILELLEENDSYSIIAMAEELNCSVMTVRRDLDDMEKHEMIKKIHGGALKIKKDSLQPSFSERDHANVDEKIKIAHEAIKLIKPGEVVFFDAGTTPLYVARVMPKDIAFTAVTNSLMTAVELCNRTHINVIMLGGEIHHSSYSSVNSIPVEQLSHFNADLALISTKAFSYPDGMFEAFLPLIEIKKALSSNAKRTVLLADHSKFESKSLCKSIQLSDIDEIITNDKTPSELMQKIRDSGIKVTIAY